MIRPRSCRGRCAIYRNKVAGRGERIRTSGPYVPNVVLNSNNILIYRRFHLHKIVFAGFLPKSQRILAIASSIWSPLRDE